MVKRNRKNKLEHWEVAMVKAMLANGAYGNDQDILVDRIQQNEPCDHREMAIDFLLFSIG